MKYCERWDFANRDWLKGEGLTMNVIQIWTERERERLPFNFPVRGAPCYSGLSENVKDQEEQNVMPPKILRQQQSIEQSPKYIGNHCLSGWLWFQRMLEGCLSHRQHLYRRPPKRRFCTPSRENWAHNKGGQAKADLTSTFILWSQAVLESPFAVLVLEASSPSWESLMLLWPFCTAWAEK